MDKIFLVADNVSLDEAPNWGHQLFILRGSENILNVEI